MQGSMSEASRFAAFLLALQTSKTHRARFRKDPKGEMLRYNLATKTVIAVVAKDREAVWRILRLPAVPHQVGNVAGVRKKRGRRKRS